MNRFFLALAVFFQAVASIAAFAPNPLPAVHTRTFAEQEQNTMEDMPPIPKATERGVSVDQDGKSNVWAIEPKMEVSTKSSEENMSSALAAGGGLAVFAVIAGLVLTNLPDPNQF